MSPQARFRIALLLFGTALAGRTQALPAQAPGPVGFLFDLEAPIDFETEIVITGPAPSGVEFVGSCATPTGSFPVLTGIRLPSPSGSHGAIRLEKLRLISTHGAFPPGTRIRLDEYAGACGNATRFWNKFIGTILSRPSSSASLADSDLDLLTDEDEARFGTDPLAPDTDGDGLLDGTEFELSIAEGWGTADPLDPDSDGDLLLDGEEVTSVGSSPGKADTDGDTIPDGYDLRPLLPDTIGGCVEEAARFLSLAIAGLAPEFFTGPNPNARQGRRNGLTAALQSAANHFAAGQSAAGRAQLVNALERLDSVEQPEDWMGASPQKDELRAHLALLVELLS